MRPTVTTTTIRTTPRITTIAVTNLQFLLPLLFLLCSCCLSACKMIEESHMKTRSNWDWWQAESTRTLGGGWPKGATRGRGMPSVSQRSCCCFILPVCRRAILHLARLLHENYKLLATGKRLFFLRRLNLAFLWHKGVGVSEGPGVVGWGSGGEGGTCQRQQKLCRQSLVAHGYTVDWVKRYINVLS